MDGTRDIGGSMKISVIIPALNQEKLLPFRPNSLKRQTFSQPYEVIVVDNNSEDRTAEWLRGHKWHGPL